MLPREGGDPDWAPAFAGEQGRADCHSTARESRRGKAASSDVTTEDELGRSPSSLALASAKPLRRLPLGAYASSPILSAAINASCGMLTDPYSRIFSLPFFCFSRSFFLRLASPP
ncbi:hypothetical protein SAMN05428984_0709 [Sphingomonas sp. OK281]|nr:hypothetical protein SAMN05428984_0709 [Sphingomonas sp. OK281]